MSRILLITLCAFSASIHASPIWEVYPKLTCRSEVMYFCDLSSSPPNCTKENHSDLVTIDFKANEYTSHGLATPITRKIISKKYYPHIPNISPIEKHNIVLDSGSYMDFIVGENTLNGEKIYAVTGGPFFSDNGQVASLVITYTCFNTD